MIIDWVDPNNVALEDQSDDWCDVQGDDVLSDVSPIVDSYPHTPNIPPPVECPRRRWGIDPRTGCRKLYRCGRASCSVRCRRAWAWRWSEILRLSFQSLPPTHFVTLRTSSPLGPASWSRALSRLHSRLRRKLRCERLTVTEFSGGVPHAHLLLRSAGPITSADIGIIWRRAVPDDDGLRYSCDELREDPIAVAKYVPKSMRDANPELPPMGWRKPIITTSPGFLAAKSRVLWSRYLSQRYGGAGGRSTNRPNGDDEVTTWDCQ